MKKVKIPFLFFICIFLLSCYCLANAASDSQFTSVPSTRNLQQGHTIKLIKTYFDALNRKDMDRYFSIMDANVIHDINQGESEQGLEKFKIFMEKSNASFDEKLNNIVIMVSDDGKYGAATWMDHGVYVKDYPGFEVKAKKQNYTLSGGHFFEIRNGKLYRVTTYYNATDFMKQIK